jgi:hypothetical protein
VVCPCEECSKLSASIKTGELLYWLVPASKALRRRVFYSKIYNIRFYPLLKYTVNLDRLVGIATGYSLDDRAVGV